MRQFGKLIIILAVAMSLFWLGDRTAILSSPREKIERISVPLESLLFSAVGKVDFFLRPLTSWWRQAEEIERLRGEVRRLASQAAKQEILAQENQELKKQLGVKNELDKQLILAHPIAIERFLIIDKGEKDGVAVGDVVVSADLLVGKVVSTTPRTSSVILPTDPESEIPVWTTKLTRGVVKGLFGRAMKLDQVLQSDPLSEGDLVLTSGDKNYPQNLLVAKVVELESEPREVFKSAKLESLIDIRRQRVFFVVKEK